MESEFDPYVEWLDIRARDRPPNYYELLGLATYSEDRNAIEEAYRVKTTHVHKYSVGPRGEVAIRILNELSDAYVCLTSPDKKEDYDQLLGQPAAENDSDELHTGTDDLSTWELLDNVNDDEPLPPLANIDERLPPRAPFFFPSERVVNDERGDVRFYVRDDDGNVYGSFTRHELEQRVIDGRIYSGQLIRQQGPGREQIRWFTAKEILAPAVQEPESKNSPSGRAESQNLNRQKTPHRLIAAAIAILIVGVFNSIYGILCLIRLLNDDDASAAGGVVVIVILVLPMIVCGGLMSLGGIAMLNCRFHQLAIVAAIISMIPCWSILGCFGVGQIIGILALFVLNQDETKIAFH